MELRPSILQGTTTEVVEPPAKANEPARRPGFARRVAPWAVLIALVLVVADGIGLLVVSRAPVRQRLTARLEAAFGRPVQVDS